MTLTPTMTLAEQTTHLIDAIEALTRRSAERLAARGREPRARNFELGRLGQQAILAGARALLETTRGVRLVPVRSTQRQMIVDGLTARGLVVVVNTDDGRFVSLSVSVAAEPELVQCWVCRNDKPATEIRRRDFGRQICTACHPDAEPTPEPTPPVKATIRKPRALAGFTHAAPRDAAHGGGYLLFAVEPCECCGRDAQAVNAINCYESAATLRSYGIEIVEEMLRELGWSDDFGGATCGCPVPADEPELEPAPGQAVADILAKVDEVVDTPDRPNHCETCDRQLHADDTTWLELNNHTDEWHAAGTVPEEQSQGCFTYCSSCAAAIITSPPAPEPETASCPYCGQDVELVILGSPDFRYLDDHTHPGGRCAGSGRTVEALELRLAQETTAHERREAYRQQLEGEDPGPS